VKEVKKEEEKEEEEEEEEEVIEAVIEPPRKKRAAVKKKVKAHVEEEEEKEDDVPEPVLPAERDDDDDDDDVDDDDDNLDDNNNDDIAEPPKKGGRSAGTKRKADDTISSPTTADIQKIKAKYANDRRNVPNDARSLPSGFRHVQISRVGNTARSLGIPYRRALVGFDRFRGHWVPIFSGVIIHGNSYNDLMTGVNFKHAKQDRQVAARRTALAKAAAAAEEVRERELERQHSLEGAFSSEPFEQRVRDAGLAGSASAVRAVRVAVGKAASAMDTPAAIKAVDAAIKAVRERYDELCALALRLDVEPLPDGVDVTAALDGSAPLAGALAPLCAAAEAAAVSWRGALAARCTPVAAPIDDATAALLVKELADCAAAEVEPMFGFDETYRIAWLVGADDEGAGVALRLAKFDGWLAQRGVRGELAPALVKERTKIADGVAEVKRRVRNEVADFTLPELRDRVRAGGINLHGATRKDDIAERLIDAEAAAFDADAALDELLASELVRAEVAGHNAIDAALAEYLLGAMRDTAVHQWHMAVNAAARDVALQVVCDHRVALFDALARDVEVRAWNNSMSRSRIAADVRASLANIHSLPATVGRASDAVVAELAAKANADIATWRAAATGAVAGHLARKEELLRLLAARGFKQEPHHVLVNFRNGVIELDVRRAIAIEFTGLDPPPPVGVDYACAQFVKRDGTHNVVHEYWTHSESRRAGPDFGPDDFKLARARDNATVWAMQTLGSDNARELLRWPPRLRASDEALLAAVVTGETAVRVPTEIEWRAARRATLVHAIRASGHPEQRMPMSVRKDQLLATFAFLSRTGRLRSRATAAALVGNVAMAVEDGDIFAALPQLAVALICEHLAKNWPSYNALVYASGAFALAAAIWEIGNPQKAVPKFHKF
jgi:hypothetical protein